MSQEENHQELVFVRGIELTADEALILQKLEEAVGEEIPYVKSAAMYNHGFSVEDKKITRLSLWKKELELFPESISELTNLKQLFLRDNKLKTIPKSIAKLSK